MTPKTSLNDPATKGDIAKLDSRMDRSDSILETMAQQIDWLYKKRVRQRRTVSHS